MTESPPQGDELAVCPHCKTANQPGIIICTSCGVRLDTYSNVARRMQSRQDQQNIAMLESLNQDAELVVDVEVEISRKKTLKLLFIVALITLILLPLAWVSGAGVTYWRQIEYQRLVRIYGQGEACEKKADHLCARVAFLAVYNTRNDFRDSKQKLINARNNLSDLYLVKGQTHLAVNEMIEILKLTPGNPFYLEKLFSARRALAEQYVASAKWQEAIFQLDQALELKPGDANTLSRLKQIYNQWITYAQSKRDWLSEIWIKRERDARFPQ